VTRGYRILLSIANIFASIFIIFYLAKTKSLFTPTHHVDGAYQTFVSLLRYTSFNFPGRDFIPYIGIGTVLPLLPIFISFGKTIGAAEFAAHFSVPLILCFQFFLTARVILRFSYFKSIICSTIPLIIVLAPTYFPVGAISNLVGKSTLEIALEPGGSLRPIRAFFPYLCLAIISSCRKCPNRAAFLVGAVTPLAPNDFAFATVFALLLFFLLAKIRTNTSVRNLTLDLFPLAAIFCATYLASVFFVSGFKPIPLIQYNFFDVPKYQGWYFGPWGEKFRIWNFKDIFRLILDENCLTPLFALLAFSIIALRKRSYELGLWTFVGSSVFLGGMVATVGGHIGGYLISFHLWFVISMLLLTVRFFSHLFHSSALKLVFSSALVLFLAIQMLDVFNKMHDLKFKLENSDLVYDENLDGYLNPAYLPSKQIGLDSNEEYMEEYSGLVTAFRGKPQPGRIDSVIHALGKEKLAQEKLLNDMPSAVISSSPTIGDWFGWSFSANWWFYRHLLQDYAPQYFTPSTLLWRRTPPSIWPRIPCSVDIHRNQLQIEPESDGLYELTIEFKEKNLGVNSFLMVRNGINQAADAEGYVAINPNSNSSIVPVYLYRTIEGFSKTDIKVITNDKNVRVPTIATCSARLVTVSKSTSNLVYPYFGVSTTPFLFTDRNWDRGIGRLSPDILLLSSQANREKYYDISAVIFGDEKPRQVESVQIDDDFIQINLSGQLLAPNQTGFPNEFRVIHKKLSRR